MKCLLFHAHRILQKNFNIIIKKKNNDNELNKSN
jgi:hypothetical protein